MKQSGVMAVKKIIIIIINERGRFACQAYIESATAHADTDNSICSCLISMQRKDVKLFSTLYV